MGMYSGLLESATKEIKHLFRKKNIERLTSKRDGVLIPDSQENKEANKYELITWLIIK